MTRYTITCIGPAGAKKRLRLVLGITGVEGIRIEECDESAVPRPASKKNNLPTTPCSLAVAALFRRKPTTPWMDDEIRALKDAIKAGMDAESVAEVSEFYKVERKKEPNFCRTSILTLCRHFPGELDKAREWADRRKRKDAVWNPATAPASASKPTQEQLEEDARARAEVKRIAAEFRARGGRAE